MQPKHVLIAAVVGLVAVGIWLDHRQTMAALAEHDRALSARISELESPRPSGPPRPDLRTRYEKAFFKESVDPSWSPDAERTYRDRIDRHLPPSSKVLSFECRTNACRLEVVHDNILVSTEFLLNLFALERSGPLARETGGFRGLEPDHTPEGKLRYIVYIVRPGVQLALAFARDIDEKH